MRQTQQLPTARLEVATGEFVTNVYVLPFNEPPQVIIWGSRIFKLHKEAQDFPKDQDVYRECFAWHATEVAP
jgi:hypothetical protein